VLTTSSWPEPLPGLRALHAAAKSPLTGGSASALQGVRARAQGRRRRRRGDPRPRAAPTVLVIDSGEALAGGPISAGVHAGSEAGLEPVHRLPTVSPKLAGTSSAPPAAITSTVGAPRAADTHGVEPAPLSARANGPRSAPRRSRR